MKKITVSILTAMLMLSMVFSSSVFAAEKENSAWDSFVGLFSAKAATNDVGVEYRGHVQNIGNYPTDGSWIQGPDQLGTVGKGLRLEAFWIKLTDAPTGLHIKYEVHVQNVGWMAPVEDGTMAGTEGDSLRIEAIKISLVDDAGNVSGDYSVSYKGHIQNVGDTAWFTNGQQLGTTGSSLRLEALEVKIEKIAPDLADYEAALAAVTEANYTKASWATYQDVVDANVVTENNVQSEVDAATKAILDAQADLVTVPVISAVTATAQKTLTVTGTQLEKLAASMFTVAGNTVTAVTPNADGTSATLTLGTNLAPETNVKVTATVDGTAKDYTVKYTIAATTVVIENQTFDMIQANQKVSLLVNGVATTADYLQEQGYAVTFAAWDTNSVSATSTLFASTSLGTIKVPQSAEADFTAQVTVAKAGTVVTSEKATIKIKNLNNNISDITGYTLTNYASGADTFTNASKSLVIGESARITKVVVGYGTAAAELTNQTGYSVASSNTAVATVSSSGIITATGLGSANLTITAGKATYTVPITVNGIARKAVSVALKDGASNFTALFGNGITNTTMTVAVKDQYGDPFVGATNVTYAAPGSITDITLNPATALGTVSSSTADGKKGLVDITVALGGNAVAGQTGNVVFRDVDNNVIGTAAIVTSNNNVTTAKKLVVTNGPTDNNIDTELSSKSAITFKVGLFNSAGVQTGFVTAANLNNYTITCDASILAVSQNSVALTASNNVYTLGTTADSFVVTGKKAGTTTLLVKAADGSVIESRTITVAKGDVKITAVSFLSPATISNVGIVKYTDVLALTEVATGKDPVLTGITTTPTSVYSIRLDVTNSATYGQIYLDKDASGSFTGSDTKIGQLSYTLAPETGSTGWAATSNAITGQNTNLGNKGTITFNVVDSITTGTPTVASKGVVVNVPTSSGTSALTALSVSAGTLSPVFAAGTTSYTLPETYATASITVTATQAAAGATITVDGTTVGTGVASGAIALDAGVAKTINVVVTEIGKTPVTYAIVATRAVDAAPSSSFTFDTGVLTSVVGSQYSLDGGTTWSAALTTANPTLSAAQLASITAANDIKVRTAATGAGLPGAVQTLDIVAGPAAPVITSAAAGQLTGTTALMEYRTSAGTTWTTCAAPNTTGLATGSYVVRVKATGLVLPGTETAAIPVA